MESVSKTYLLNLLKSIGFNKVSFLSYRGLLFAIESLRKHTTRDTRMESLLEELLKVKSEVSSLVESFDNPLVRREPFDGTFVIVALSYYSSESDDLSTVSDQHALIAPFARRNYYKETSNRLKELYKQVRSITGLRKRDGRIFCNSRVPEKPVAYVSGLGLYGRNSLIIVPELGSLFVIGVLFFPLGISDYDFETEKSEIHSRVFRENYWQDICSRCDRCISSCPVRAIEYPGVVKEEICISYISAREIEFPDSIYRVWGKRLYGCQTCQDVCPYNVRLGSGVVWGNRNSERNKEIVVGDVGPSLSIKEILLIGNDKVKELFKGTQMGLAWVSGDAIKRNALVASGNSGDKSLIKYIKPYLKSNKKILREAAQWALKKLES